MNKINYFLLSTVISLFFISCSPKMALYSVSLSSVESPANAKLQYGETKVISFMDKDNINKFRYEDDYINIVWYVDPTSFNFVLQNKSEHTLKINWDDISYVDINGRAGRVMHAGVKFIERNSSQPATTIPKSAVLNDILTPTDNVYYQNMNALTYGGWKKANLIPSFYKNIQAMKSGAPTFVGKKMKILMPILIENVQNDYVFEFNVDEWLNKASATTSHQSQEEE